jgi:hypothetical protein
MEAGGTMSSPRRRKWRAAELGGGWACARGRAEDWFLYPRKVGWELVGHAGDTRMRGETTAWPATCVAPAANGAPRAVRRPVYWCHLARSSCHGHHLARSSCSAATGGHSGASACAPDAGTARTTACRRGRARRRGRACSGIPRRFQFAEPVFKRDFL